MALFDDAVRSLGADPVYVGNPPTTEAEYLEQITWPEGVTAPTWAEIETQMALEEVTRARLAAYLGGEQDGTLNRQLEKLWDDIDAGLFGADAKTGLFYTFVSDIKAANPKPE